MTSIYWMCTILSIINLQNKMRYYKIKNILCVHTLFYMMYKYVELIKLLNTLISTKHGYTNIKIATLKFG